LGDRKGIRPVKNLVTIRLEHCSSWETVGKPGPTWNDLKKYMTVKRKPNAVVVEAAVLI